MENIQNKLFPEEASGKVIHCLPINLFYALRAYQLYYTKQKLMVGFRVLKYVEGLRGLIIYFLQMIP